MIKIDYLINRDEGNHKAIYIPKDIPNELPILAYVQGPNSTGKSTLLNILALSFFGQNLPEEELNPELRNRIQTLINSDHQAIKFKIEIDNKKLGVKLISEKFDLEKKQIILKDVTMNGETFISEDSFKREYKLIYDIPNNPLERLPLLLHALKNQQKDVSIDIERFRQRVLQIIDEIKNSRDPEKLFDLRQKIEKTKTELQSLNSQASEQKEQHKKLQEYYLTKYLVHYRDLIRKNELRINEIKQNIKQQKKDETENNKTVFSTTKALDGIINDLETKIEHVNLILSQFTDDHLKTELHEFINASFRDEITYPEIYKHIRINSELIINYLDKQIIIEKPKNSQNIEKQKLLMALVNILDEYKEREIQIPGVNLSLEAFLDTLKNDLTLVEISTNTYLAMTRSKQMIENIVSQINAAIKLAKDLQSIHHYEPTDLNDDLLQKELNGASEKLVRDKQKLSQLQSLAIQSKYDPNQLFLNSKHILSKLDDLYNHFSENELVELSIKLRSKYDEVNNRAQKLTTRLEKEIESLAEMEAKQPHKFQDKYYQINKLLKNIQLLEKLFRDYDNWLGNIITPVKKFSPVNEQEVRYQEQIGSYLAKKIGRIRHISDVYDIQKINILKKELITVQGLKIRFSDLGTGQGQSAYLEGLLSMNENKKIIALFDEVAMMDDTSLNRIKEKLRNLYEEKKLLLAVIVQKGNEVKIEDMLCTQ